MEPDFLTRLVVRIPPELRRGISTSAATVRFGSAPCVTTADPSRHQEKSAAAATAISFEGITPSHEG